MHQISAVKISSKPITKDVNLQAELCNKQIKDGP